MSQTARHGGAVGGLGLASASEVTGSTLAAAALIASILFEHLALGGNRGDLSLSFTLVHAAILGGVLVTPWGQQGLQSLRGWTTIAILFGLVLLAIGLSLIPLPTGGEAVWGEIGEKSRAAIYPLGVIEEATKLVDCASVFTLAGILACERQRSLSMMRLLIISAAIFGAACLILEALSPVSVFAWQKPSITRFRVSGLFSSANTAATVFGLNALISAGGLLRGISNLRHHRLTRRLSELVHACPVELLAFVLNVECLLLSGSRGGIVSFCIAFGVLMIWRGRQIRGAALAIGLLVGAFIAIAFLSGGIAIHRYVSAAYARDDRVAWDLMSLRLALSAPFQGFGLGSFPLIFQSTTTPQNYSVISWAGSAHNLYLQWLVEGGLLAAIPMIATIGWILKQCLEGIPKIGAAAIWRPTLVCATLLVFVHSFVEYSVQEPSIAILFSLLLGASIGFSSQISDRRQHI